MGRSERFRSRSYEVDGPAGRQGSSRILTSKPRGKEAMKVRDAEGHTYHSGINDFERDSTGAANADNSHNVYSDAFSTGGFLPFRFGGFPPSRISLTPAGGWLCFVSALTKPTILRKHLKGTSCA